LPFKTAIASIYLYRYHLSHYFKKTIPQRNFIIEAFTVLELDNAIATRKIDFVLTNPGSYIQLKERYNLSSPLASLIKQTDQHTLTAFAGVIFTLATRTDINQLKDLQNQHKTPIFTSLLLAFTEAKTELIEKKPNKIRAMAK
jgi:hypothetical protein